MSVGHNIRSIRTLRGMTQKELGLKAGFSATTADVRIRQYESEKMVPKEDKLNDIAKALDVDVCAFTDHNITSDSDIMHIFFELENYYGLKIDLDDSGKPILYFDENHQLSRFTNANLDNWYRTRLQFAANEDDSDYLEKRKQYALWKSRYPLDMRDAEDGMLNAITEKYNDLVYTVKSFYKIKRVKEFITLFENLLKNGFDIVISPAPERSGLGSFVCSASFKSSQLLEASKEAATAYAEFLAMTYQLEDLGIEIERTCDTFYGEIVASTYFYSSILSTALNQVVKEMIAKYKTDEFNNDLYQLQLEDSLQTFNIPIEDAR